jgi:hypothetical protein
MSSDDKVVLGIGISAMILTSIAAYITHVVWIVSALADDKGATAGQIILGLLGIFVPPVGVIHGLTVWFN